MIFLQRYKSGLRRHDGNRKQDFNAIGREVAALIPGTRFEVMEDAGHFPHLQAPETVVGLARDFLG